MEDVDCLDNLENLVKRACLVCQEDLDSEAKRVLLEKREILVHMAYQEWKVVLVNQVCLERMVSLLKALVEDQV